MDGRKREILQAAWEMFSEYGIRSVSIEDICRAIGISKKTLYQYFDNKADLVESLLIHEIENVMRDVEVVKKPAKNAIQALLLVSKTICRLSMHKKPSAAFDLKKYYPDLYKKIVSIKREHAFEGIRMNMERGIKEGLYRNDLNVELVANLYVQKIEQLHEMEFSGGKKFTSDKIFEVMFENHIRGISNSKGIEVFENEKKNLNYNINDTSA